MGNHSSPQLERTRDKATNEIPSFYYLSKESNLILKFQGNSAYKHSLSNFNMLNDCSIGYLPDGRIIIAGGIKSSGKLSKKVHCINTVSKAINSLPSLQFACKQGTLIYSEGILYYFSQDLSMNHQFFYQNK